MDDFTRKFNLATEKDAEIHQILLTVYQALEEKGYNPINQIVGYILSEDPTYITNHNNARTLIRKIDGMSCCRCWSANIWANKQCFEWSFPRGRRRIYMRCPPADLFCPFSAGSSLSRNFPVICCGQTLTNWIKSVTIRLQLFEGVFPWQKASPRRQKV